MQVKPRQNLWWFEPAWSYRPQVKAEIACILDRKMWLRIGVVVTAITIVLATVLKRLVPGLEFNWGQALVFCVAGVALILLIFAGVLWWIPPLIQINRKGVCRQQGNSARWRQRNQIQRVIVDATDLIRPCLVVEGTRSPWRLGLGRGVEPAALAEFLRRTFPELLVDEKR